MLVARSAAALGLLVVLCGEGCESGTCSCPSPLDFAVIDFGCVPIEPPVVKTTGPCAACPGVLPIGSIPDGITCGGAAGPSQNITLIANGAGTCHVELTFGSGVTSSVDLDFMSVWAACGSDPHGCGQGFVAATTLLLVPEPTCDAGASDAGLEVDAPNEAAVDAQADAGGEG
jgi:hypothetical protein